MEKSTELLQVRYNSGTGEGLYKHGATEKEIQGGTLMYDPSNFHHPPLADSHPRVVKADSDRRAEVLRESYRSGGLLWELGFILSLPVRVPLFLWGKLRRSVNRTIVFPLGREQKASRGFLGEEH